MPFFVTWIIFFSVATKKFDQEVVFILIYVSPSLHTVLKNAIHKTLTWRRAIQACCFSTKLTLIKKAETPLPCCTFEEKPPRCMCVWVCLLATRVRKILLLCIKPYFSSFFFGLQPLLLPYCWWICYAARTERTGYIRFASLAFPHARNFLNTNEQIPSLDIWFHICICSFLFTFN